MRDNDLENAWDDIRIPPGEDWSGRRRYAAAMTLYSHGLLDAETLEIYRICSRLDQEDPLSLMRRWHVGADWIDKITAGPAPASDRSRP